MRSRRRLAAGDAEFDALAVAAAATRPSPAWLRLYGATREAGAEPAVARAAAEREREAARRRRRRAGLRLVAGASQLGAARRARRRRAGPRRAAAAMISFFMIFPSTRRSDCRRSRRRSGWQPPITATPTIATTAAPSGCRGRRAPAARGRAAGAAAHCPGRRRAGRRPALPPIDSASGRCAVRPSSIPSPKRVRTRPSADWPCSTEVSASASARSARPRAPPNGMRTRGAAEARRRCR